MSAAQAPRKRPLSPHLQVYKPQITSVLSILHRVTGIIALLGVLCVVCWLVALSQNNVDCLALMQSWLGKVFLFAWTLSLFYHFCNGIRHLLWDVGVGLEIEQVRRSGYIMLAAAAVMTLLAWVLALTGGN